VDRPARPEKKPRLCSYKEGGGRGRDKHQKRPGFCEGNMGPEGEKKGIGRAEKKEELSCKDL